jgi:hypothetical protein
VVSHSDRARPTAKKIASAVGSPFSGGFGRVKGFAVMADDKDLEEAGAARAAHRGKRAFAHRLTNAVRLL